MPSNRTRSRSQSRERSKSPDGTPELPYNASPISESDYFLKSSEFQVWLREEKGKYFDELSGDKARSYFRKFVRAWNKGKLSKSLYAGIDPSAQAATTRTAYKWSFASKNDANALKAAREAVGEATYGRDARIRTDSKSIIIAKTSGSGSGKVQGPSLPSVSDLVLAREAVAETREDEKKHARKRARAEALERVEDMVGPKEVGKEGMLEKKRVRRDADRAFRDKGDDGFEADEKTLLGGGDSFREQVARRDAARRRFEEKRNTNREEKVSAARDRVSAMREKDKATMDMFQQLAKQRFG